MSKIIIGVTGTLASGKDTVSDYLIKKGFAHFSLSATLRDIMRVQGIPIKQPELTDFGNSLREKYGHSYLVEQIKDKLTQNSVVSSIRQPGEVEALKKMENFYLIFVDAPVEERFKRLRGRGRNDDPQTLEEFKKIEDIQMTGVGGGMNLGKCKEMADFQVDNSGTLEALIKQTENVLQKITDENKN